MSAKSDKYDRMFPATGISEAQKEERIDRREIKARRSSGHPMRITVPSHFEGFGEGTKTCDWVEVAPGRYKRVPLT